MSVIRVVLHNNLIPFGSPASTAFCSASRLTAVALTAEENKIVQGMWGNQVGCSWQGPQQYRLNLWWRLRQSSQAWICVRGWAFSRLLCKSCTSEVVGIYITKTKECSRWQGYVPVDLAYGKFFFRSPPFISFCCDLWSTSTLIDSRSFLVQSVDFSQLFVLWDMPYDSHFVCGANFSALLAFGVISIGVLLYCPGDQV